MKIAFTSDVHTEFPNGHIPEVLECDVMILAGDIGMNDKGVHYGASVSKAEHVIYVAGNHEFYRGVFPDDYSDIKKAAAEYKNFNVLQNSYIDIGGIRFIGATLWTDCNLDGNQPYNMAVASTFMNDYRVIKHNYNGNWNRLRAEITVAEFIQSKNFIEKCLQESELPCIVVTHFGPSRHSIHPRYEGVFANTYYVSNLDGLIMDYTDKIKYWIHGHVHSKFDYMIGETRVMTSPIGYPGENDNPGMTMIEIT